jgi:hypothetical protein
MACLRRSTFIFVTRKHASAEYNRKGYHDVYEALFLAGVSKCFRRPYSWPEDSTTDETSQSNSCSSKTTRQLKPRPTWAATVDNLDFEFQHVRRDDKSYQPAHHLYRTIHKNNPLMKHSRLHGWTRITAATGCTVENYVGPIRNFVKKTSTVHRCIYSLPECTAVKYQTHYSRKYSPWSGQNLRELQHAVIQPNFVISHRNTLFGVGCLNYSGQA